MDVDFDPSDVDLTDFVEDGEKGRKILRLAYPIEVTITDGSGIQVEEVGYIEFRRPIARDLDMLDSLASGKAVMAGSRKFVAALVFGDNRINERKIADMDAEDMMRAMAVCFGFFQKPSQKTSDQ